MRRKARKEETRVPKVIKNHVPGVVHAARTHNKGVFRNE